MWLLPRPPAAWPAGPALPARHRPWPRPQGAAPADTAWRKSGREGTGTWAWCEAAKGLAAQPVMLQPCCSRAAPPWARAHKGPCQRVRGGVHAGNEESRDFRQQPIICRQHQAPAQCQSSTCPMAWVVSAVARHAPDSGWPVWGSLRRSRWAAIDSSPSVGASRGVRQCALRAGRHHGRAAWLPLQLAVAACEATALVGTRSASGPRLRSHLLAGPWSGPASAAPACVPAARASTAPHAAPPAGVGSRGAGAAPHRVRCRMGGSPARHSRGAKRTGSHHMKRSRSGLAQRRFSSCAGEEGAVIACGTGTAAVALHACLRRPCPSAARSRDPPPGCAE
jgi:hypothetical protein